mmetsp:Transcript_49562/g.152987  ORF Transcript_49562/g.152987 Transcript_49562/m.152987 type:complete len:344 (-) Transcript_49562:1038-2069(-)
MPLDGLQLLRWCLRNYFHALKASATIIEGQQITRNLVLDEELHEILSQLDLFCEAICRQVQYLLQLWLDLDNEDAKQGALKLHGTEGLGKRLLFRRERLDRILELLWRRDGRHAQGDGDLVFVLHDGCMLRLEGGGRGNPTDKHHHGAELPGPSHEGHLCARLVGELVRKKRVEVPLAPEVDVRRGAERELHGVRRCAASRQRDDRRRDAGVAASADGLLLYADGPLGRMHLGPAHSEAEGDGKVLLGKELAVVEPHVLGKVSRRNLLSDGSDELLAQQALDVVNSSLPLAADLPAVHQHHDQFGLLSRGHRVACRERLCQGFALLGERPCLLRQEAVGVWDA